MGRELPSPSLFKEEAQQLRKGKRLGQKTLFLPQEPLAQGDERHNMLDPIGIEVLQLHLVVL